MQQLRGAGGGAEVGAAGIPQAEDVEEVWLFPPATHKQFVCLYCDSYTRNAPCSVRTPLRFSFQRRRASNVWFWLLFDIS